MTCVQLWKIRSNYFNPASHTRLGHLQNTEMSKNVINNLSKKEYTLKIMLVFMIILFRPPRFPGKLDLPVKNAISRKYKRQHCFSRTNE